MFCTNCGTKSNSTSKFCHNCGQSLAAIEETSIVQLPIDSNNLISKICDKCHKKKRQIYIGVESSNKFVCKIHDTIPGICPNCTAKLRTEKAEQCFVCKASWRETKPVDFINKSRNYSPSSSSIKCPKCKSDQITADRKGIGVKRALFGGAIAGPLGLLAGLTGRKKIQISCLRCGYRWTA